MTEEFTEEQLQLAKALGVPEEILKKTGVTEGEMFYRKYMNKLEADRKVWAERIYKPIFEHLLRKIK